MKLFYSDIARIAEAIGYPVHALWGMMRVFQDPFGGEPFTTETLALRRMCQYLPTAMVREALGH